MITFIKPYLDIILAERSWSWSLIGILYVLAAFFVRSWFMNSLVWKAKQLDKSLYHAVKSAYLKRSVVGWFLFFVPLALFTFFWQNLIPQKDKQFLIICGGTTAFILSIILHLRAFALGTLTVLKKHSENLKEKNLYEA